MHKVPLTQESLQVRLSLSCSVNLYGSSALNKAMLAEASTELGSPSSPALRPITHAVLAEVGKLI